MHQYVRHQGCRVRHFEMVINRVMNLCVFITSHLNDRNYYMQLCYKCNYITLYDAAILQRALVCFYCTILYCFFTNIYRLLVYILFYTVCTFLFYTYSVIFFCFLIEYNKIMYCLWLRSIFGVRFHCRKTRRNTYCHPFYSS